MRRVIITAAAFVSLALLNTARSEALDAPLMPNLHDVSPWTPSSVQLVRYLIAAEQYQAALQRYHAWLEGLDQRSPEGGDTR